MEGHKSKTGNGILAICMGKNYQDSLVVFREYIQNACDSIYEATKQGIFQPNEEKYISVNIAPALKRVSFMDRGTGVAKSEIGPRLVDLGASLKNGIDQIGSYGIGRLVGANWCDRIVFETSVKGETEKSILTFDSVLAHKLIQDKTGDCSDSLDQVTKCVYQPEKIDEHYFRVTLENVKDSLTENIDAIKEYLSSMVPVNYSYEFYQHIEPYLEKYPEYNERIDKLIRCNVYVGKNDEEGSPIEKPYTNVIYTDSNSEGKKITPPSFFEIKDSTYGLLAWGWYSLNEKIEQMNSLPYRGIRLRKHNMAIGNIDYLSQYFPKPVDANYFIGEIHIVHDEIQPTGTREAIETSDSQVARTFLHLLKSKYFPSLKKDYENLSKLGSSAFTPIINSKINHDLTAKFLASDQCPEDKKEGLKKSQKETKMVIDSAKEDLKKKIVAIRNSSTTSTEVLDFVTKQWDKKIERKVSEQNSKNPNEMHIDAFKLESIIDSAFKEDTKPSDEGKTHKPIKEGDEPETVTIKEEPTPKETDGYKVLGKSEYNLMKSVYQVINAEKKLDPSTKENIKKKLEKKILGK